MSNLPKVLVVAAECAPVAKASELGDVVYNLPRELQEIGVDARVILPLYKNIDIKKYNLKLVWREKKFKIRKNSYNVGLWSGVLPESKTQAYFIENKKYFGTASAFSDHSDHSKINESGIKVNNKKELDRFNFFSEAAFNIIKDKKLSFDPEIIHTHDWHCGTLLRLIGEWNNQILKSNKKIRKHNKKSESAPVPVNVPIATVVTVHNLWNQGIGSGKNFLKEGIINADLVTTTSGSYAEEIKDKNNGFGLHSLLRKKSPIGILNGLDYDSLIPFEEKDTYKTQFQEKNGLKRGVAFPMFSMVGPLRNSKGVHLVVSVISYFVDMFDAQFVFLGSGNEDLRKALVKLSKKYPENVLYKEDDDHELVASVYAASDFTLIPSEFESCGIAQMIAMSYGTLPVARATGGLKETIRDGKNGFVFGDKNEKALSQAIQRALTVFADEESFNKMRENALEEDFSWEKSATHYVRLYKDLKNKALLKI